MSGEPAVEELATVLEAEAADIDKCSFVGCKQTPPRLRLAAERLRELERERDAARAEVRACAHDWRLVGATTASDGYECRRCNAKVEIHPDGVLPSGPCARREYEQLRERVADLERENKRLHNAHDELFPGCKQSVDALYAENAQLLADADASQHWQTRALRAEERVSELERENASLREWMDTRTALRREMLEQLEAENAQLYQRAAKLEEELSATKHLDDCEYNGDGTYSCVHGCHVGGYIASLEEQNAQLRADSERLEWLERERIQNIIVDASGETVRWSLTAELFHDSLRDAIDAVMDHYREQQAQGGGEE